MALLFDDEVEVGAKLSVMLGCVRGLPVGFVEEA